MTLPPIPPTAVVRVSRGNFDPARFADVERMARDTGGYLIPAISRLDGLLGYYAGASPAGSMIHVSLWRTNEDAQQMGSLTDMAVRARGDAEAAGVTFIPIVNYPLSWHI
jgi:hypothetical protein